MKLNSPLIGEPLKVNLKLFDGVIGFTTRAIKRPPYSIRPALTCVVRDDGHRDKPVDAGNRKNNNNNKTKTITENKRTTTTTITKCAE